MKIIVATLNRGKLVELARMLELPRIELVSIADAGDFPPTEEDGTTYDANATKKAREAAEATGIVALGDDSGIEVDALDGAPGVRSARYAGENAKDGDNVRKLLAALSAREDGIRTARFRCVLVLAAPTGEIIHRVEGICEGAIAHAPRGKGGFGYDPVFVPAGMHHTMAELEASEKDRLSHRGIAALRMRNFLEHWIETQPA